MPDILELLVPFRQEQTVLSLLSSIHRMDDLTPEDDFSTEPDPLMLAFSLRLTEMCRDKGYENGQPLYRMLAKRFGQGPKGVQKWFMGRSWPRNPTLMALAEWGDVTIDWLMSGRGPKNYRDLYASEPIARVATMMLAMEPEQQSLAARLVDQVAQPASTPTPPPSPGEGRNGTHGR